MQHWQVGLLRVTSGSQDPILQGLEQLKHATPVHALAEPVGIQARLLLARELSTLTLFCPGMRADPGNPVWDTHEARGI